ncbi:MAG: LytTR family DNA-binding domain-containing protein [Pseudohongiellaceae bacterium]|jgi:LytTr DNA-binding domain
MTLPSPDFQADPVSSPTGPAAICRYLATTGGALLALVLALQPDPGFSAPWPWMATFWFLQIVSGLAVLQGVLYLLSRRHWAGRLPLWMLVLSSGVLGSALLAPVYWLIGEGLMQSVLGFPVTLDDADDPGKPELFGVAALLQEFLDIVGQVTAAWVLISWPRLPGLLPPLLLAPAQQPPEPVSERPAAAAASAPRSSWRKGLPRELGDDLIAVSSELQYLRVWTTRGAALVLGALQDVEQAEGSAGVRLHRSWWVHARHVRGLRRSGDSLVCLLSDGRELPVSRRRRNDVLARFGDGARYAVATAPAAQPLGPAGSELASQSHLD